MLLVFISITVIHLPAQIHSVVTDPHYRLPVKEKLDYRVHYKFSVVWIYGAYATFTTDTLTFENKRSYKFNVDAFTRKKYRWIYDLEDHYTSITDYETFLPLRFEEHNIEKGVKYDYTYIFDWENNVVDMTLKQSEKQDRNLEKKLPDFITDSFSAVHYLRLWNYNEYSPGDTIEFKTMLNGKIFDQQIVYLGKESIKDAAGKEVDAFTLKALMKNSSFFSHKNGIKVWIADNKERWIVKVDANIIIGRIIVFLDTPGIASFDTH